MAGDVHLHRDHFRDRGDDWVYDDGRLNLLHGPDDKFLQLLCQMIHPIVCIDESEAVDLAVIFNKHLTADGYEIVPQTYISGRAIHTARQRVQSIDQRRKVAGGLSSDHIAAQITRMESSVENDPALAIGSAKEFVESICKGILDARNVPLTGGEDIQKLVKLTRETLDLVPSRDAGDTLRKTLNALASHDNPRHSRTTRAIGVRSRHHPATPKPPPEVARLAVHSATALAIFLYEVHRKSAAPADQRIPLHGWAS